MHLGQVRGAGEAMRALNVITWIAAGFGVAVASMMLLIAVDHDPRGVSVDQSREALDFTYASGLFFS
jgi:type IV secretory pathway TrbD component